ncbi:MAG: polysaccharide deacetylase family protein [Cloacibacillus sp.]
MKHYKKQGNNNKYWKYQLGALLCVLLAALCCAVFLFLREAPTRPVESAAKLSPEVHESLYSENVPLPGSAASLDIAPPSPPFAVMSPRVVCLTFDDGPSVHTARILDILKKYDVPATFFLVGQNVERRPELVRRMKAEGHRLAVHTYTHDYRKVYASVGSYLDDFYKTQKAIYSAAGERPVIFRFPGGSVNNWNRRVRAALTAKMTSLGFRYYDWNVSGADSAPRVTSGDIYANISGGVMRHKISIVLMHDTSEKTMEALERVIVTLKKEGVVFKSIDGSVPAISFHSSPRRHIDAARTAVGNL